MHKLTLFLQNCFNANWPKEFNASAFCYGVDVSLIQDSKEITNLEWEVKADMARALLEENKDMVKTSFYMAYLYPIEQILKQ